jgi:hypothetical protein
MCRLAYIPGNCKVNRTDLVDLLHMLQKSFGGDGNGFVAVGPNGEQFSEKGVKLDNDAIVVKTWKLIKKGWSLYYHTRKISVGWSSDKQCHPHLIKGEKFNGWLCHNGTWNDGVPLANYFNCGSDTAALARCIGKFGIEGAEKRNLFPKSGVFLIYGSENGESPIHRVVKKSGDLQYCPKTGIWASEFDKDWPYWSQVYTATVGKHLLCKPAPQYIPPVRGNGGKFVSRKNSHPDIIDSGIPAPWDDDDRTVVDSRPKLWERLWPQEPSTDYEPEVDWEYRGGYPRRDMS